VVLCQHNNLEKGPDIHATTEGQLIGNGNEVAYRWTFRGAHQGEFFGVPGTAPLEMSSIQIDSFDESGKLVKEWPEHNLLEAMRQMAAIPGPY
jgi:predicted ester cyclase